MFLHRNKKSLEPFDKKKNDSSTIHQLAVSESLISQVLNHQTTNRGDYCILPAQTMHHY